MSDIGTPISSGSIPAVGTSGTTYASNINLFLTEVKNRLEAKVPRTSLDAGDLDLDGYDLQNAGYLGLASQVATPTTPTGTLQSYAGELYWVGTGGVVKITDGTTINAASIGGITGDYGDPNPAQFRFVDADQEYYAYDNYSGGAWARVWAKNFDLAAGSTSAFRVRMAFGGGASYTFTFPAAVPSETTQLRMDSSGNVTVGRQTLTKTISSAAWITTAASSSNYFTYATAGYWTTSGMADARNGYLYIPITLDNGDVLSSVTVYANKASDASNAITITVEGITTTGSGVSLTNNTATSSANAPGAIALTTGSIAHTIDSTNSYRVLVGPMSVASPSAADFFYGCKITYTSAL